MGIDDYRYPGRYHQTGRVVCFDPSQNYTGWLVFSHKNNRIQEYGCLTVERLFPDGRPKKKTDFRRQYQTKMANHLFRIIAPGYKVAMEFPHGSQSANAAWGLGMISALITAVTVSRTGNDPFFYSQREAKKYMFEAESVEKSQTKNLMWKIWEDKGIVPAEVRWAWEQRKAEFRKYKEAVADAMLILNYHLHMMSEN